MNNLSQLKFHFRLYPLRCYGYKLHKVLRCYGDWLHKKIASNALIDTRNHLLCGGGVNLFNEYQDMVRSTAILFDLKISVVILPKDFGRILRPKMGPNTRSSLLGIRISLVTLFIWINGGENFPCLQSMISLNCGVNQKQLMFLWYKICPWFTGRVHVKIQ